MPQLAIKGHATRGKEVIEILEMLGGKNSTKLVGSASSCGYYIDSDGNIAYHYYSSSYFNDAIQFTLEKFLEKFPYKVGDKVIAYAEGHVALFTIQGMRWNYESNKVEYKICSSWLDTGVIFSSSYKEEVMEENTDTALAPDLKGEDYSGRRFGYKIPKGYEFECVRNNEIILKPIKPQYPKTYEECCKVLNIPSNGNIAYVGDWVYGGEYLEKHLNRLRKFQQLLICRDAYWKMAGDQMGLGKPWKPRCDDGYQRKWIIFCQNGINFTNCFKGHFVLAFPTPEMRDTFYENFKDLIEQCKELL